MSLTKLEFRKIFTPMTFITLAVMLVVNVYAVFQQQGAIYAESDGKMQRLYEMRDAAIERSGVIDDEWIAARKAEAQVILTIRSTVSLMRCSNSSAPHWQMRAGLPRRSKCGCQIRPCFSTRREVSNTV